MEVVQDGRASERDRVDRGQICCFTWTAVGDNVHLAIAVNAAVDIESRRISLDLRQVVVRLKKMPLV